MIFRILFFLALAAIAAGCLIAARIIVRRPLKPFARNLLIALILLELVTAALHLLALFNGAPPFWDWFFDLQYEMNLGSIFSALQLMVIAVVALLSAILTPALRLWQRLYWLLLVAVFVFLSLDEFYSFHETLGGRSPTEAWRIPYAIVGGFLFLVSAAAYWFGFRRQIRLFVMLFMGLIITAVAGIGVEEFVLRGFVEENPSAEWMYVFEEVFEMIGATIILAGFLSYLQENVTGSAWRLARRLLLGATVVWTGWMLFSMLLLPALEARLIARPVNVRYAGGLSLVGYQVEPSVVEPGDEVALTLYWRADRSLSEDYSISVHALSHPDVDSVAQSDDLHIGPIPSSAWFPHVVMKRTVYLQLPRSLPAPESYDLMLRVWYGPWPLGRPWQDTTGVPVESAEGVRPFAADSILLDSLSALSPDAPPAPPVAATYSFAEEGILLNGYDLLPETLTSSTLPVQFWWQARQAVNRDLTQFFHLMPQGGGDVFAFDQQPFGGRFPTRDWVAGLQAVDAWQVSLPEDVPAGTYDVFTGLYDVTTMERLTVTDAAGQAVPNNAIFLGTLAYEPRALPEATPEATTDAGALCYAIADSDVLRGSQDDVMVAINRLTGAVREIGRTGTLSVEGLTFSADGSTLYTADERDVGQFGAIDLETGQFTPVGAGLSTEDAPARNAAIGADILLDVDSIAVDPTDGRLWAAIQDGKNYLFEIDPATGQVIRDRFGEGTDYLKIDLDDLPDHEYSDVEDLAIDPRDGAFYVIISDDANYFGALGRLDFDRVAADDGTIAVDPLTPFISTRDGETVLDMEALSFASDGTMYGISSNNSNVEANYDVVWQIDPVTGLSTPITQITDFVDAVDYEALACLSAGAQAAE